MQTVHDRNVTNKFGPRANAYVESAVHSQGEDLERLGKITEGVAPDHALDLGCGGGHVAYAMAPHAKKVTASDLSDEMLAAVAATAKSKGLGNIETIQTSAEKLPFADATFDMLGCRYSAHHWQDVDAGFREARRVLMPGATAVFIDCYAPAKPLLDTHLQSIELLRDTSHVRDYSISEWTDKLGRAGFGVNALRTWRLRMDFPVWIARMATPQLLADAIRALQNSAPAEIREHFAIEPDGSFMLDMVMLETMAA
ncbi:methyltransferase domain-containing protein [Rhizobium sp. TH2]|uniref:class I SAM-dependent methyltransferase n=1 Tax=Rhizobium sp. TH2 TaxID=2775403 RepID=UPI0021582737|nr:methyltransferase domain-containing protein [Rhizobium sp. TH2]UVC11619.1 methyltransferase domain-containing protein [Rhizobium sp. TH2]